jgi:pimeloyl-ACP methyl ester carboxylesterase
LTTLLRIGAKGASETFSPLAYAANSVGFWAVYERAGAIPAMARALIEAAKQANVSEVLPTIRVPTLVLHRTGDIFPIAGGRYFAKRVSGARFVELPGDDHAFWAGTTTRSSTRFRSS